MYHVLWRYLIATDGAENRKVSTGTLRFDVMSGTFVAQMMTSNAAHGVAAHSKGCVTRKTVGMIASLVFDEFCFSKSLTTEGTTKRAH